MVVDDNRTHLANDSYLGLGAPVIVSITPEPDVRYTLADLTNSNDPDTGDSRARVASHCVATSSADVHDADGH